MSSASTTTCINVEMCKCDWAHEKSATGGKTIISRSHRVRDKLVTGLAHERQKRSKYTTNDRVLFFLRLANNLGKHSVYQCHCYSLLEIVLKWETTLVAYPKTNADGETAEGDAPPETAETEKYK